MLTNLDENSTYSRDESSFFSRVPALVLLPETSNQVAKILEICSENDLKITIRGGGTGLMGGSVPLAGGLVLSLERLNRLLKLDLTNKTTVVEAGMVNLELQRILAEHELFFPCDPGSWGSSQIGGNLATNASGARGARYGSCQNYVLNLEVALPNGRLIWTAPRAEKHSGGIPLTQLFVGSEGQLGVITQAKLKLVDLPKAEVLLVLPFASSTDAFDAVESLKKSLSLHILEFIEQAAVELTIKEFGKRLPRLDSANFLFLVVDESQVEMAVQLLDDLGISPNKILVEQSKSGIDRLMEIRKLAPLAVKANGFDLEFDCVVALGAWTNFMFLLKIGQG